jgi:succinate dehydrogenase assembly factor 2
MIQAVGRKTVSLLVQHRTSASKRALLPAGRCVVVRGYQGEAGEGRPTLSAQEEALLKIARPKSEEIFAKHVEMPKLDQIPRANLGPEQAIDAADEAKLNLDIRRKRLIYRSKQRGWLEVDLLLGTYASEHVHTFVHDELNQFEAFVNLETIDIYNIITLRLDIPEHMKTPTQDSVIERIQKWARGSPLGKADPEKYRAVKSSAKLI